MDLRSSLFPADVYHQGRNKNKIQIKTQMNKQEQNKQSQRTKQNCDMSGKQRSAKFEAVRYN